MHQDIGGAHGQGNRGEELIDDSEHAPQRVDVPRIEQVAPGKADHHAHQHVHPPVRLAAKRRLRMEVGRGLLEDEARHTRARLQEREDEERLKHDHEVIPVGHQLAHPREGREDLRHADGERHRAARAPGQLRARALFQL